MERPETIANFAVNSAIQNLPKDFYTNYLKSIDNVTIADAQNAAKLIFYLIKVESSSLEKRLIFLKD